MNRGNVLKWLLRLSAVLQVAYWSLSHLFWPGWYLWSVGMVELATDPGESLIFIHEIGILTLGIGFATWLAARDPIKHLSIIAMLYVVGLGSIAVSLYHMLSLGTASGEWLTVGIISAQMVLLTILYPWKDAIRQRS